MTFETLALSWEGPVATVILSRPHRLNALNAKMKEELAAAFASEELAGARAVILTGAGERAFSAGADIHERSGEDPIAEEFIARQRATYALFGRIAECPAPTIAAINGVAFGGGLELALCCDFRFAAATAKLGLPEIRLGAMPVAGGTQRLSRLVGVSRAKRLLLFGEPIAAADALAIGLVDEVVEPSALAARAAALAGELAARAPLAARAIERVVDRGGELALAAALDLELSEAAALFTSEDRKEGMRAFIEKRAPRFVGR